MAVPASLVFWWNEHAVLRVLIADDHVVLRRGLKDILRESLAPLEFGEAGDGEAALALVQSAAWDVLILDITMPGLTGLQVLRQVKQVQPRLPVLMLSMHSGQAYVDYCLRQGAAGYLCKESAPEELVRAVRTILAGRTYYASPDLAGGPRTPASSQERAVIGHK